MTSLYKRGIGGLQPSVIPFKEELMEVKAKIEHAREDAILVSEAYRYAKWLRTAFKKRSILG